MLPCTSSNEQINVCEIVDCFNCEQVEFPSMVRICWKQDQAGRNKALHKLWDKKIGSMRNFYNVFSIDLILQRELAVSKQH